MFGYGPGRRLDFGYGPISCNTRIDCPTVCCIDRSTFVEKTTFEVFVNLAGRKNIC